MNLTMAEVHTRKYQNLTMGSHVEVPETDDGRGSHEEVQDGMPSITKPVLPSNSLSELPNVSFFYL
jgi:hypothetical protein